MSSRGGKKGELWKQEQQAWPWAGGKGVREEGENSLDVAGMWVSALTMRPTGSGPLVSRATLGDLMGAGSWASQPWQERAWPAAYSHPP